MLQLAVFLFVQWKKAFSSTKIFLIFITAAVLLAGTIQGAVSYANYCSGHGNYYGQRECDFGKRSESDNADVDFVAVVTVCGVGALFWVSLKPKYVIVITMYRPCMMFKNFIPYS